MLEPIESLRVSARSLPSDEFCKTLGGPLLLQREAIEGDLLYAGHEHTTPTLRPGATLLFESVRPSLKERLAGWPNPGRRAVPEQVFRLARDGKSNLSVGRALDNDLVLKDPAVSQHHARLHVLAGTDWAFATDVGSRNGVGYNGRRLAQGERAELLSGDELSFGSQAFIFLGAYDLHRYLTGKL